MTETEILIHNRHSLRPGDILRVWPQDEHDRWAEGPIHETNSGGLMVGGLLIGWVCDEWITDRFDLTAYPARRTVPDLPTERGSVVRVTRIRGTWLPRPSIGVLADNSPEPWWVTGYGYCRPEEITSWIPLAVTEAGPEVTR